MPLFTEMHKRSIRYFHIDHNAPCLPPKILHNYCFQFLLGNTVVPREIEENGYAFFFLEGGGRGGGGREAGLVEVNKVHYGLRGSSDILQMEVRLKLTLFSYGPSM